MNTFRVETTAGITQIIYADRYEERESYTVFIEWVVRGIVYKDVGAYNTDKVISIRCIEDSSPMNKEQS